MQLFTHLPERRVRLVRWGLLLGWLLLIASLLLPAIRLPEAPSPSCPADVVLACAHHRQPGNRLFWGTVVPFGLLLIGVCSHELWRRICPLAFVSQLARALGRQRTRPGRQGRPEVVMVEPESWLGRQAMHQRLEGQRSDLDPRLAAAGLAGLPASVPAEGTLEEGLDLLWSDPDPDTAGWVLMLLRQRDPQRVDRQLRIARAGLAESPFLASQRRGDPHPDREKILAITSADLFADLLPADVLWVAGRGSLRAHTAGEAVMVQGGDSDSMAVVLRGALRLLTATGAAVTLGVGQSVGERGVITGEPRNATVQAGPEGACLFVLPAEAFEDLLLRSHRFGRELLAQLAQRMAPPATAPGASP